MMTLTNSSMLPLQTIAPDFNLLDTVSEKKFSLNDLKSDNATVIMFICNHCPYVKHVQHELVKLANDYQPKGISFIAISANDAEQYPEDSPEKMHQVAQNLNYPFVYLYDETQQVAKAYRAECTPDFYLFDDELHCVYRGRLDASTPGNNVPVTGRDLRLALDALLIGQPIDKNQHPSMGCNIKWRS